MNMAEDKAINVRLNGHNYSYWSSATHQYSRPSIAFTAPTTDSTQQYSSFEDYQQFRTFLAITHGGPSQAFVMATTNSGSGVQEADWDRAYQILWLLGETGRSSRLLSLLVCEIYIHDAEGEEPGV